MKELFIIERQAERGSFRGHIESLEHCISKDSFQHWTSLYNFACQTYKNIIFATILSHSSNDNYAVDVPIVVRNCDGLA